MTFADRLEELRKAATPTNSESVNRVLMHFLANNADAILELVRAAESVRRYAHIPGLIGSELDDKLRDALAKLNGEQT